MVTFELILLLPLTFDPRVKVRVSLPGFHVMVELEKVTLPDT
jgi:hypothetical protein